MAWSRCSTCAAIQQPAEPYAWSEVAQGAEGRRFVVILQAGWVDSPRAAVRAGRSSRERIIRDFHGPRAGSGVGSMWSRLGLEAA
jgi:hypothetical protein